MILFEKDFREEQKEPPAPIDKERRLEALLYNCKIFALEAEAKIVIEKKISSYEITLTIDKIDKAFFNASYADMIDKIIRCCDSLYIIPPVYAQDGIVITILYSIPLDEWDYEQE